MFNPDVPHDQPVPQAPTIASFVRRFNLLDLRCTELALQLETLAKDISVLQHQVMDTFRGRGTVERARGKSG